MKVVFVTPAYFPNLRGGNERSIKIIAEGLAKQGINVTVFSFDSENKKNIENYNGVKVIRLKKINIAPNTFAHNMSLLKYKSLVLEEKPDIMHVFNTWHIPAASSFTKYFPVVATLNNYFPLIATAYTKDNILEHKKASFMEVLLSIKDTLPGNVFFRYTSALFYTVYSSIIRRYSKRINHYVVYADAISKIYSKWGFDKRKFTKIYSPFPDKIYHKNIKREKNSVLYVGGIFEAKGFFDVLESSKLVKNKDIKFYFVGIDNVPAYIKKIVMDNNLNVSFIPKLNHEKLANYYLKSSVLIHPSLWPEPFSRVWLEALGYNIPIISSDNPVALEVLKGSAAFYRRGDCAGLAKTIDKLFNKEIKIDNTKAKNRISNSDPVKEMISLYKTLV